MPLGYLRGASLVYALEDTHTTIGRAPESDIILEVRIMGYLP
jgi:hypothetical protein